MGHLTHHQILDKTTFQDLNTQPFNLLMIFFVGFYDRFGFWDNFLLVQCTNINQSLDFGVSFSHAVNSARWKLASDTTQLNILNILNFLHIDGTVRQKYFQYN